MTLNPNWFLNATGQFTAIGSGQVALSTTTTTGFLTFLTKATTANITSSSTSVYTDGPSVSQGTSGTWYAVGTLTIADSASSRQWMAKLWDGTTTIASAGSQAPGTGPSSITLAGVISGPAGNLRMSCIPFSPVATFAMQFNYSGNSNDCNITAIRIG